VTIEKKVETLKAVLDGFGFPMAVLHLGRFRVIWGGPYRDRPLKADIQICMAREIDEPATYRVEAVDFGVPSEKRMLKALKKVLYGLALRRTVFVGCAGGLGRTGLFMAVLMAALGHPNPVAFVRRQYRKRAVETPEQEKYVEDFPYRKLRGALWRARLLARFHDWWVDIRE